jgi:hypothetical protein
VIEAFESYPKPDPFDLISFVLEAIAAATPSGGWHHSGDAVAAMASSGLCWQ